MRTYITDKCPRLSQIIFYLAWLELLWVTMVTADRKHGMKCYHFKVIALDTITNSTNWNNQQRTNALFMNRQTTSNTRMYWTHWKRHKNIQLCKRPCRYYPEQQCSYLSFEWQIINRHGCCYPTLLAHLKYHYSWMAISIAPGHVYKRKSYPHCLKCFS